MLMGIGKGEASFLISVIGISNIIGKLGFGYISDLPRVNRLNLYNMCLAMCGLSE